MSTLHTLREALEARGDTVALRADAVDLAVRKGFTVRRRRRVVAGVASALLVAAVAVPIATGWSPAPDTGPAVPSPSASQTSQRPTTSPPTSTPVSELSFGARATVPYAIGNVFIAGDLQIETEGYVSEFTTVGDAYAVVSTTTDQDINRLELVTADGSRRELDRGWITGVAAAHDGSGVALAWGWVSSLQSSDGELRALQSLDGAPLTYPLGVSAPPGAVIAVTAGRVVFIYQADPGGPPLAWDVLEGTTGPVIPEDPEGYLAGVSADGATVVLSGSGDGCLTAYDVVNGGERWSHCSATAARFSPDGRWLVDHTGVYDAPTGAFVRPFEATYEWLAGIAWEDDDHVLLGGEAGINGEPVDGPLVRCTISTGACERVPIALDVEPGTRVVITQR